MTRAFLEIDPPPVFEVLVPREAGDGWSTFGVYARDDFSVDEDNIWLNTVTGSPFYMRVTEINGDEYTCVDGGGDEFLIRIVAVRDPSGEVE